MTFIISHKIDRRTFTSRAAALSIAGAGSSYALGLAGLSDAAAQSMPTDYKALVCIFLAGGNDHANTLVPVDVPNYSRYAAIRGGDAGIAIPHQQLMGGTLRHPTDQVLTDDLRFALNPAMPNMRQFFNEGKMASLLNVGPLVAPITRAQYDSGNLTSFPRPAQLFSHNDQQATWQAFGTEGTRIGWGGRLGDLALSANQNSMFTAISASGNVVFLNGARTAATNINPAGPSTMWFARGTSRYSRAMTALLKQQSQNILQNDCAALNARSIDYSAFIDNALRNAPEFTKFGASNSLAAQLSMVARLISVRQSMGVSRQVFFVSMSGFDTHGAFASNHPTLLSTLDTAVAQFYRAIQQLGLENSVTSFTASDFGRTLTYNGDGTDHGWGSHHFVLGGGVNGGRYFGRAPRISTTSDDQVGNGRLLPTTSVDEYATTLALWFGVSPSELGLIAPNIGRFARPDLGFMKR
ncbi:DUF1501 domain-containing protein [Erythrobacter sp. NE805]|uniref:DUF1501 domain-containing protein n=1 Tax=Erythrobacter sp. NE805 TaxID=3389875 RepID=UPI00396B0554